MAANIPGLGSSNFFQKKLDKSQQWCQHNNVPFKLPNAKRGPRVGLGYLLGMKYHTVIYGDYFMNHEISIPSFNNQYWIMKSKARCFFVAQTVLDGDFFLLERDFHEKKPCFLGFSWGLRPVWVDNFSCLLGQQMWHKIPNTKVHWKW